MNRPDLHPSRGLGGVALTLLLLVMVSMSTSDLLAQKIRLDERAAHGVSQTYHQGKYYMAWAGESNRLYVLQSEDGVDWRSKVALDERSSHAPDIASNGDALFITWIGENTNDLYVIRSTDGVDWRSKIRLNERSDARPAIAGDTDGRMLIAWKGENSNRINILRSRDGVDWRAKVQLDESTLNGPTLGVFDGRFYLAWTGVTNNDLYVMRSDEGVDWRAKVRLDERGRKAPSLAGFDGNLYIAWQGDAQGDIYVMQSRDGVDWRAKQRLDERTLKSLKLAAGHKLTLGFQGETSDNIYFLMIRDRVAPPPPPPPPANRPPAAMDDAAKTERGLSVVIPVLANDSDSDGDRLAVVEVGRPINGLAESNRDGTITYVPSEAFIGNDVFTYIVDDGAGGTAEARVSIQVEEGRAAIQKELQETGRATLRGIYFDFDSDNLKLESEQTLFTVLGLLQDDPNARFIIEGHTDADGAADYNLTLSQRRAQAVVNWLVRRNIDARRLSAQGYGESRPKAGNDTDEGRALNRRVEIVQN